MKLGFIIEGKTLNVDLLLNMAKAQGISPEEMSLRMGMGKLYLRNRHNENKKGLYREAGEIIVERAMKAFDLSYEEVLVDIPKKIVVEIQAERSGESE